MNPRIPTKPDPQSGAFDQSRQPLLWCVGFSNSIFIFTAFSKGDVNHHKGECDHYVENIRTYAAVHDPVSNSSGENDGASCQKQYGEPEHVEGSF